MKKLLALIVAIFILMVSVIAFQFTKIFLEVSEVGQQLYDKFGKVGAFLEAIIYLSPLIVGIWIMKLSWRKITYEKYEENTSNISGRQNEDTSLTKAVYNHSKDIGSEIKPKIDEYKEKHSSTKQSEQSFNNINEDEIYEQVMIEIEEDKKVKSTWAKALAQSEGNRDKAEALYINERVLAIRKDLEELIDKQFDNDEQDQKKEKKNLSIESKERNIKRKINPQPIIYNNNIKYDGFLETYHLIPLFIISLPFAYSYFNITGIMLLIPIFGIIYFYLKKGKNK